MFLIFVQGLTAPDDAEIRTRILSKLEQNLKISLQMATEECKRIENLRRDTVKIDEHDVSNIQTVKQRQQKENVARRINPCYGRGQNLY